MRSRRSLSAKGISGSAIKWIALTTMLIDHIGAVVLQRMMNAQGYAEAASAQDVTALASWTGTHRGLFYTYLMLRLIGRIAFPLFCFLLVEGFQKTRDVRKYMARLAVFALISEVPFDLAVSGTVVDFSHQNVYFTLLIGLLFLYICDELMKKQKKGIWLVGAMFGTMLLAEVLHTDYASIGVLVIIIFYLFRMERMKSGIFACALLAFAGLDEIVSFLSLIPIKLYNGERGRQMKYFFYAFYPVHLLVLYLVSVMLGM